jgi:hypothetical protein
MSQWQNADGLTVKFAGYFRDPANSTNKVHDLVVAGAVKQIEIDFDLTRIPTGTVSYTTDLNNDGTKDGFNLGDGYFPANSSVLRAALVMSEAAVGGTSFTAGTYTIAGAAIAATGLVTATEGVLANVNAIGKRVYGAGALVAAAAGTAGVGTADAFVGISTTGTFTAGKGRLIIEYVDPTADFV